MSRTILNCLLLVVLCTSVAHAQPVASEPSPFVGTWALRGSTSTRAGALAGHFNTRVRLEVKPDPAGGLQIERRWRVTLPGNAQRALVATARGVQPEGGELRFELVLDGQWVEGLTGALAGAGRAVTRTNRLRVRCWFDPQGTTLREEVANDTRVAPEHFWASSRCEGTRLTAQDLAPAPSRVTLVQHGPAAKRYDLTIVSEGYTPDELPVFRRDAREVVERLRATTPFKEYWNYLNIHRVDIVSARAGLAHGERGALGTTLPVKTPWAERMARWSRDRIEDTTPGSDAVLVIADDDFRSAAAEGFCVASAWPDDIATRGLTWGSSRLPETAVHELGHTIGRLLDEYDSPHPYDDSGEHGSAPSRWRRLRNTFEEIGLDWTGWGGNVTSSKDDLPWRVWLGSPEVGAHEGAYHQVRGWYRPTPNCMMRDTTAEFCVVCRELLVRALSRRAVPVHVVKVRLDAKTWRLGLYPSIPGKARFRWLRNGFEVGTGSTFIARYADTWHQDELTCDVTDTTAFVRDGGGDTTFRVRFVLTRRADLRLEGPAFE